LEQDLENALKEEVDRDTSISLARIFQGATTSKFDFR